MGAEEFDEISLNGGPAKAPPDDSGAKEPAEDIAHTKGSKNRANNKGTRKKDKRTKEPNVVETRSTESQDNQQTKTENNQKSDAEVPENPQESKHSQGPKDPKQAGDSKPSEDTEKSPQTTQSQQKPTSPVNSQESQEQKSSEEPGDRKESQGLQGLQDPEVSQEPPATQVLDESHDESRDTLERTESRSTSVNGDTANENASNTSTSDISPRKQRHHRKSRSSIALARGNVSGTEMKPAKMFIQAALEKIRTSKDARRMPALQTSASKVLDEFLVSPDALPAASAVLEPLRLVCAQGTSTDLKCVALDTIGRLFSLSYLDDDDNQSSQDETSVLGLAVDTVYDAYDGELTNEKVELQIVKALTAAVVNEDVVAHGQLLLKAIRQVYQVFVVSRYPFNQTAAQGALTQMVQAVFDRVKAHGLVAGVRSTSTASLPSPSEVPPSDNTSPGLTLDQLRDPELDEDEGEVERRGEHERVVQDAFLLFRTLCKLSDKTDVDDNVHEAGMRSKLLSLHLLHTTLKTHISVFKAPQLIVKLRNRSVRFAVAIKDYLWLTLSNNAASSSPAMFEVSAEIFWLVFSNLRSEFKREIEIFLTEIYFTIMDLKTATMHQKLYFMGLIGRLCTDPRALVELFLNYDCDPSLSNVFENLVALIARLDAGPGVEPPPNYVRPSQIHRVYNLNLPTSVALQHLEKLQARPHKPTADEQARDLHTLRLTALDALVDMLQSLVLWTQRGDNGEDLSPSSAEITPKETNNTSEPRPEMPNVPTQQSPDDPSQFETRKSNKRALDDAIAEFNFKPSRGVNRLLELGIIKVKDPAEIARTLLHAEGIDKVRLGEYLGGSDEFSRTVMHQFVNMMDFRTMSFIQALRQCLQAFRLPGEGQVVDRYMLEFATKYHEDNPTVFTNADTPYVLAYSVMMLNTELHSSSIRRSRMTFDEFLRNNRGVNDGLSLPDEFLREIYDEIDANEIKLESEQQEHIIKEEGYGAASAVISSKTAELFRSLNPAQHSAYYNASHVEHVGPMFEVAWMSILAGLSGPFQQYSRIDMLDSVSLCLEGMGLALRIACHFDVDLARTSFVQTLAKSSSLDHVDALKPSNIEAVRTLLLAALGEGEMLRQTWYDVLLVVSELERIQLVAQGVPVDRLGLSSGGVLPPDVADAALSRELVVASDHIFTQSASLTPTAMVDFISALARLSHEEIKTSRNLPAPRLFALQKMVDVCHYNMARIRMEWTLVWQAMAPHFNEVLTDESVRIVEFALDSLRQLSMRFLELEELPHFSFQHDFLAPFDYALRNNDNVAIKILVLECLKQMVVTKASKLKSGWSAVFSAVRNAPSLEAAYDLVALVPTDPSAPQGFLDAVCALAEQPDAKVALKAVSLMDDLLQSHPNDLDMWHEIFTHMSSVVMRGKDLEVRGKCLSNLFSVLTEKGDRFSREDWDRVFRESLFPLFSVLHAGTAAHSGREEREEMSLWLSSTLIQALKSLVQLFGNYFTMLEHALEPFFLDLLRTCITQENDPVSRMGNSCFQQLVQDNVTRFTDKHWHQIATTIVVLFQDTTPSALVNRTMLASDTPNKTEKFRGTVAKVIQTLLVMDTVGELLVATPAVLERMPVADILRVTTRLKMTYHFARDFNLNHDLRVELYQSGVVRQTPNLLMQECTAAKTYVSVSMRLFRQRDRFALDPAARQETADELLPLCQMILRDYNKLEPTDHRYIKMLMPIVESILRHMCRFSDADFAQHVGPLYLEVIEILNKDMTRELREAVQAILRRVADVHMAPQGPPKRE